jgi:hypothetical protein
VLLDKPDFLIDVDGLDVVQGSLRHRFGGLAIGHPGQVVGAYLKGVRQSQAVVDRHKPKVAVPCVGVKYFLHKYVAGVPVDVQKPDVQNCNFVDFLG